MACLPQFPSTSSIPPACFYNIQGLSSWLNKNPDYKQYFIGAFPFLCTITSSMSSLGYNIKNVPLGLRVTTMSQYQAVVYNQQIAIFHKVYTHNSNAYVNYICSNVSPVYYTFTSYKEKGQYDASIGLINKLYPFDIMANAPQLNWKIPFPM